MDNDQVQYDQRQISSMADQLSRFARNEITIAHLIQGLESLSNLLQTTDSRWKESFKSEWWILEQAYAVALDRNKGQLSAVDREAVAEAVQNLNALVEKERARLAAAE